MWTHWFVIRRGGSSGGRGSRFPWLSPSSRSATPWCTRWDRPVIDCPRPSSTAQRCGASCDMRMEAAGTRLDVNAASDEMIASLLYAMGYGDATRDMVDALADRSEHPFADIRALARVTGFEDLSRFDTVFTTEP